MESQKGFLATLSTFILWGFLPVYWKLLESVPPFEIICHRIIWSVIFLVITISFTRRWKRVVATLNDRKTMKILLFTGLIVGCNWLIYIWAVNTDRVLEASLGYYINPLVLVLFGYIFFRERPRKMQWLAISIAAGGIFFRILKYGNVPLASLGIAISFATYGMLRKKADVDPLTGLLIETAILSMPALILVSIWGSSGTGSFGISDIRTSLLLVGTGIATSVPLMSFVYGAKRIQLLTVGILQYIAPTITFFLGIFLYHEPFQQLQVVTFLCIWTALLIYTAESFFYQKKLWYNK